jgi:hypothetical protein
MKKRRIVVLLMAAATCVTLLTGCSSISAKVLVQGNLDTIYLNQYDEDYINLVNSTAEELGKEYEEGIGVEVEYFAEYFDIDLSLCGDSYRTEIDNMLRRIYMFSKYEVGSESKNGETYLVEVTIYPIDIISKIMDEDAEDFTEKWQSRVENGEFDNSTEEEVEQTWAREIIDMVDARINSIGYLDPQTISVQVTKDDDDYYRIDSGDFDRIDSLIIQYS